MRNVTLVDLGAGPIPAQTPTPVRYSAWFPLVPQPAVVPPVTGGGSTPVADGVLLEWDAVDSGGAEVIYIIDRSAGPTGPWEEVARTTATRYLYSDGSGATWYFRITPSVRGQPGGGNIVVGTPQLVAKQQALDAEAAARLQGDLETTVAAGADATAKANAALAEALARVDALAGEVGEIVNAPQWLASEAYIVGWLVVEDGQLYRAKAANTNKRPSTNAATWELIGQFASAAEAAAAALQLATATASDLDAEAIRIAALQARMPAGAGVLETKARVDQVDQARVSGDQALAVSISSVSTVANDAQSAAATALTAANGAATLANTAQTTANAAQSTATNALTAANGAASSVAQVSLRVPDTPAEIIRTGRFLPVPGMGLWAGASGWAVQADPGHATGYVLKVAGGGGYEGGIGQAVSCEPGEIIDLRADCYGSMPGGETSHFALQFINSAGGTVSHVYPIACIGGVGWKFGLTASVPVPAGAIRVRGALFSPATGFAFWQNLSAKRRSVSEQSSATATQSLSVAVDGVSGRLAAKQTVATDVNGRWIGFRTENDGLRGGTEFLVDYFRVHSAGGAATGMEWESNYIRVFGSGYQLVMGTGFGSGSNLVQWFGPNIGAANCTTANCIECKTTTGQTIIRGSNSQGTLEIMNTEISMRDSNGVKRIELSLG